MNIYASYLVTCITACFSMYCIALCIEFLVGLFITGFPDTTLIRLLFDFFCILCAISAVVSIVLFLAVLCQKKASGSTCGILLMLIMQIWTESMVFSLSYEEVEGTQKAWYIFLVHLFPTGYLSEILTGNLWLEKSPSLPVWVLITFAVSSLLGAFVFCKKDLK